MSDDLPHRLSSLADEMERAVRGKSAEDLHELFARACLVMREAAMEVRALQASWRMACGGEPQLGQWSDIELAARIAQCRLQK